VVCCRHRAGVSAGERGGDCDFLCCSTFGVCECVCPCAVLLHVVVVLYYGLPAICQAVRQSGHVSVQTVIRRIRHVLTVFIIAALQQCCWLYGQRDSDRLGMLNLRLVFIWYLPRCWPRTPPAISSHLYRTMTNDVIQRRNEMSHIRSFATPR
jgi:hypothetical protein